MIRKLLLGLIVIVAIAGVIFIVAAMQPSSFRVERSATIASTPQALFERVNEHTKPNPGFLSFPAANHPWNSTKTTPTPTP